MAEPGFETVLSGSSVYTLTITSIAAPEERDGTSRERNAWRVFQTEGTASTKALRQEQPGARNRALLENSIGE